MGKPWKKLESVLEEHHEQVAELLDDWLGTLWTIPETDFIYDGLQPINVGDGSRVFHIRRIRWDDVKNEWLGYNKIPASNPIDVRTLSTHGMIELIKLFEAGHFKEAVSDD